MLRSILAGFFLTSLVLFAQQAPSTAAQATDSQPTTALPSDTKLFIDACLPIDKITAKTDVRSAPHIRRAVINNFQSTDVGQIVDSPKEAEYVFVVIAPPGKQMAVLVPVESYLANVTWLNPLRGEVNVQSLISSSVWDSAHTWNKARGFAIGLATFGAFFGPELKVGDLVTKFKNEMLREAPRSLSQDRHDTRVLVQAKRRDRREAAIINKQTCDLNRVFKATEPPGEPAPLPPTPIKLWLEPLSVASKSECVVNLDVRDGGTMSLEKQFAGDNRFQLTKKRDEAEFVLSIVMFKNKNIALFLPIAAYKEAIEWEDASSAKLDLCQAWKTSLWRSNQKNQRMKTAGVALISYGLFQDSGDKSAADLIKAFRNDIAE